METQIAFQTTKLNPRGDLDGMETDTDSSMSFQLSCLESRDSTGSVFARFASTRLKARKAGLLRRAPEAGQRHSEEGEDMKRLLTKSFVLVALVGAMTAFTTNKAEAAFQAWICNDYSCQGGDDVTVVDQGAVVNGTAFAASGDSNPLAGAISLSSFGAFGFSFTINNSTSHPLIPEPQLDLNFVASSLGAGDVYIWTADDFTVLSPLSAHIGGTTVAGATITPVVVVWPNFPGDSGLTNTFGPAISGAGSYAEDFTAAAPLSSPYRMWLGVHLVHTVGGISSGDFHVVPEPVSLSLMGLGLAAVAARRRRRTA